MIKILKDRIKTFKKHSKGKILFHHVLDDIKKSSQFISPNGLNETQLALKYLHADRERVTSVYNDETEDINSQIYKCNSTINSKIEGEWLHELLRVEELEKSLNSLNRKYDYYCRYNKTLVKKLTRF